MSIDEERMGEEIEMAVAEVIRKEKRRRCVLFF